MRLGRGGDGTFESAAGRLARDLVLGGFVGVLAGFGSFVFLSSLDWATSTRGSQGWLLYLLPLAGLALGLLYTYAGGDANRGTNLIIDELHEPSDAGPPRRMAPLVLVGATVTHLFGGSGGREGAAVQIAASLTSLFRRHLSPRDRRAVMVAAVAGGFGSVFGVPAAGTVFAVEVPTAGHRRYTHLPAALAASFVGDRVARGLGIHHRLPAPVKFALGFRSAVALIAASLLFGWCAAAFIELTHLIRRRLSVRVRFAPLRPVLGGVVVVALTLLVGTRAYNGLSLPLIDAATGGVAIGASVFAWKLVFTSVTIGAGFPGGEVTPLFCIGACLGSVLAGPLGLPRAVLAAVGMVAVFAAASNTPLACTLLGVELFGGSSLFVFLLATIIATAGSGERSVYERQRIAGAPCAATGHPTGTTMASAEAARLDRRRRRLRGISRRR
jgi:H+/Cl- antiporter ClcA